jgi:hypothetical protein
MIAELDRYHGVVLRQLLVSYGRSAQIGVVDESGRVDAFCFQGAAFQIKHSAKRLSPWRFTYLQEHVDELSSLAETYKPVWVMLVCGVDGVVGVSLEELSSILEFGGTGAAWIRVSRSRNSMYRVGGGRGDLEHAKRRGVAEFLTALTDLRPFE